MLDFMRISTRSPKRDVIEIYPKFIVKKSSDLMIRGRDFYAVWVEDRGLWSTDEDDVTSLVDRELTNYANENGHKFYGDVRVCAMEDADSGVIDKFHKYCQKQMRDSYNMLDEKLIFSNTETNKKDYASKRLPYPLEPGEHTAWDKLVSTLYSDEERHKIEWAIGSIVTGDSKTMQKFMVLYGAAGTGKSTVLNIVQQLFEGYYSVFDAKALGSANNQFSLEAFKNNPLVAIQHDGDLSKIEDNTRLNSLVSHEIMTVNEKFKGQYENRFKCFLFMGTNKPVKITDGKSGLLRRLIDVTPTGNKIPVREYKSLMKKITFELGAIACHCRDVYLANPNFYDDYIPVTMFGASNDFYNFIIDAYHIFKREDGTTLKAAWEMYKNYCEDARVAFPLSQRAFKEELKNYFQDYSERFYNEDGSRVRSYYSGFKTDSFNDQEEKPKEKHKPNLIKLDAAESLFDIECADCLAQYANDSGTPTYKWDNVTTKLSDLDTSKLHFVKVPENHIVIDFDIKDKNGKKSLKRNLEEASKWPPTYAEISKSGGGVHLHYIYAGDATKLSYVYDDNIEIKVFAGKSSLRRMLTSCNNLPIATISSGLPLKGEKMIKSEVIQTEKGLRTTIKKCLNKEVHSGTKPNVDFIYKILEEAYASGLNYDVSDMQNAVLGFAANSTNQAEYCIKLVNKMQFKSKEASVGIENDDDKLIFYDVEVFPNLFVICWKLQGEGNPVVRMINPGPVEIEELFRHKLVGFNCRKYDNHILYARYMGYSTEELFNLSKKIIYEKVGFFGEAYNISYTDIFDFAAKKQSLKKWEIELGIHHQELGLPWNEPVDEKMWTTVADYCVNDVVATEAVFNHLQGDFTARKILAELAGLTANDTTNTLTTRIIFGREKKPNLVYTDLSEKFPGYEFVYDETDKKYHNMYRGTDLGFGGYVYAEPGMYNNVALLDVASLHPHSIIAMNCFGDYTQHFKDILDARIFIKHGDFDSARKMLSGRLAPFLDDESKAKDLAQALKIAINSVYGLTAANFDNPFRDVRNKNNIVALRGALFMRALQDEVQKRGFTVVHIKTDSIKIADATQDIIDFCMDFAKQYGYTFEHEATYDRICLVNDAVYIAKYSNNETINGKHVNEWTATGAQFAVPYVFKKLFSKEPIEFKDMCETKEVKQGELYLDRNENLPDEEHNYIFVGRVGSFCPIKPGCNGGILYRINEGKNYAATGTKGYRWLESEMVQSLGKEEDIDRSYYDALVNAAKDTISKFGDFEWFVSEPPKIETPPWLVACGKETCEGCPHFKYGPNLLSCDLGYDISDLKILNDTNINFI